MEFPIVYNEIILRFEKLTDGPKIKPFHDKLVEERAFIGSKAKRSLELWNKNIERAVDMMDSNKAVIILAEREGEIVGLASIFMQNGKMDHFGGLGIMVDLSVRNLGLGTKMMELVIQWGKEHLNGLECIELGVIPENIPAIKLYRKLGFETIARLPKKLKHFGVYYDEEIMNLWV